jgi:hypothetical protein
LQQLTVLCLLLQQFKHPIEHGLHVRDAIDERLGRCRCNGCTCNGRGHRSVRNRQNGDRRRGSGSRGGGVARSDCRRRCPNVSSPPLLRLLWLRVWLWFVVRWLFLVLVLLLQWPLLLEVVDGDAGEHGVLQWAVREGRHSAVASRVDPLTGKVGAAEGDVTA